METKARREDYPICPRCGSPMAIATMTSKAVRVATRAEVYDTLAKVIALGGFKANTGPLPESPSKGEGELHYHIDAISVYCTNSSCNYDLPARSISSPPPEAVAPDNYCNGCDGLKRVNISDGPIPNLVPCPDCSP